MAYSRRDARLRRHKRLRKCLSGTGSVLRISIYRSLNNLNAQLIDDTEGRTVFSMSTLNKEFKAQNSKGGNIKAAAAFGELFAKKAIEKGFTRVVFDRGGYAYHGRIKAFADSARKAGLVF